MLGSGVQIIKVCAPKAQVVGSDRYQIIHAHFCITETCRTVSSRDTGVRFLVLPRALYCTGVGGGQGSSNEA